MVDDPRYQLPLAAAILALLWASGGLANVRRFRALFVLVFLVVRSRRVRAERMVTVIGLSVIAYLVSLGLLIFVSSRL